MSSSTPFADINSRSGRSQARRDVCAEVPFLVQAREVPLSRPGLNQRRPVLEQQLVPVLQHGPVQRRSGSVGRLAVVGQRGDTTSTRNASSDCSNEAK